jgi:hypothetical protein
MELEGRHGPLKVVSYHCTGCKYLETKDWQFFGDDDERDTGTDAQCRLHMKSLGSYWTSFNQTPEWCDLKHEN